MPKYSRIAKPNSFISKYLEYCSVSETATSYDFWTACWLLSSALGRSIIIDRTSAPIFLNLYIILVAESGITRKSTAIRRATKLYQQIKLDECLLVESKITPELLEFQMHQQSATYNSCQTVIAIDELVKFLGREKYVSNMPTLLTDFYDCPTIRSGGGTLARGTTELRNIYVSFLSASTPSWLLRAVNPDVIEGGFTSRVMFIVSEQPKKLSPWPEPINTCLEEELLSMLRAYQQTNVSKIGISDGAKKRFGNWYKSRAIHRDPFRASFQSREDAHILRLAGLLSISEGVWEIQISHIMSAIEIINAVREDGAKIFDGTGSNSKLLIGLDKLRECLLAAGVNGIQQSELGRALIGKLTVQEATTMLNIMHDLGLIKKYTDRAGGRGRPSTLWKMTKHLATPKAIDSVIEELFNPS